MQGRFKTKIKFSFTTSQVPSKKRHEPGKKKIESTTDDKDLCALKARRQSSVKGKDLSLWFMQRRDLSLAGILYASHLHYTIKVLSCHFTEHRD